MVNAKAADARIGGDSGDGVARQPAHTHAQPRMYGRGTFGRRNAADSAGKLGIQRVKTSFVAAAAHQTQRAESDVSLGCTAVVIAKESVAFWGETRGQMP